MAKAKTASKNNPNARASQEKVFYEGREITPVLFIGDRKYIAAQYEDGSMPMDASGDPMTWSSAAGNC